jgi:ATP-GRASP peptide maturase of grasp-with-spasm system
MRGITAKSSRAQRIDQNWSLAMLAPAKVEAVMILILSTSRIEYTTEDVTDWLKSLGADVLRINGEDLDQDADLCCMMRQGAVDFIIKTKDGITLDTKQVSVVWWRRWQRYRRYQEVPLLDAAHADDQQLGRDLIKHLDFESRKLNSWFFSSLRHASWLSHPDSSSPNKLSILEQAAEAGLHIPETIVTTNKADVIGLLNRCGRIVTKPIGEADPFRIDGQPYAMYTAAIESTDLAVIPERFRASLFQEFLAKSYEIRVFYLAGECHAMAIFSQNDDLTRIDFRRYNYRCPNRSVPYSLKRSTALAIGSLMCRLRLETGSIDLIHTPDGRDVFLEVNPVGQFGMVSIPCNYGLERKVADLLMQKEKVSKASRG